MYGFHELPFDDVVFGSKSFSIFYDFQTCLDYLVAKVSVVGANVLPINNKIVLCLSLKITDQTGFLPRYQLLVAPGFLLAGECDTHIDRFLIAVLGLWLARWSVSCSGYLPGHTYRLASLRLQRQQRSLHFI